MDGLVERNKKRDGSCPCESLSESSSRVSTSDASSEESRGKESCSSPAPLGWPIRKSHLETAIKKCEAEKERNSQADEGEGDLKKLDLKISGFDCLFNLKCHGNTSNDVVCSTIILL